MNSEPIRLRGELPLFGRPIFDARYIDFEKLKRLGTLRYRVSERVRRALRKIRDWFTARTGFLRRTK
ncbi:MAG: hypothetical protein Q8P88_00105 [Candidatus Jorgensenbacteria bacterium]|nr:hypothetical protein [Candidatus Jorgensenbacteria bacterium]